MPKKKRRAKLKKTRSAGTASKVTRSFTGQVADFIKRYRPALETLAKEDRHDLAVVAERRNEPSISLSKIKKRLRKRGLL
jgi:GTP1/Obg family GTP-binding protein